MNDEAGERLRAIVQSEGKAVVDEPWRLQGLLADRLAEFKLEANLLGAALEEGVPSSLLHSSEGAITPGTVERLTHQLETSRGFENDKAAWAVNTWASALSVAPAMPPGGVASPPGLGDQRTEQRPGETPPPWVVDRGPAPGGGTFGGGTPPPPVTPTPPPAGGGLVGKWRALDQRKQYRIVAIVGALLLIIVLLIVFAGGGDDDNGGTTTTKPTVTTRTTLTSGSAGSFPNPAEAVLLAHVPAKIRSTCERDDEPLAGITVALHCEMNTISVYYSQFPTISAANAKLDQLDADNPSTSKSCDPAENTTFKGFTDYQSTDKTKLGRLKCYLQTDGTPRLSWTNDGLKIFAEAIGNGSDKVAERAVLYTFWRSAGPLP